MKLNFNLSNNYADTYYRLKNKENFNDNPAKENYSNLTHEIIGFITLDKIIDYEALNKLLEPLNEEFEKQNIKTKEIDESIKKFINSGVDNKVIELLDN